MLVEHPLMERVERINVAVVYLDQQAGFVPRQDLYAMNIDYGRNCYSYGRFGHITRNCKNKKIIEQGRRLEYGNNENNNLNGEKSLVVLD